MGMAGPGLDKFETDGNAGKFGFVPICYIKIAACKHPGLFQIIKVKTNDLRCSRRLRKVQIY
jgi:hypothetical protein